jgi:mRNA interferase MazF
MMRGDIVTVAAPGDYGKPRPAVYRPDGRLSGRPSIRTAVSPTAENGLRVVSQIMADKPVTVRRERIGARIGRVGAEEMARLNTALAFVKGLAD